MILSLGGGEHAGVGAPAVCRRAIRFEDRAHTYVLMSFLQSLGFSLPRLTLTKSVPASSCELSSAFPLKCCARSAPSFRWQRFFSCQGPLKTKLKIVLLLHGHAQLQAQFECACKLPSPCCIVQISLLVRSSSGRVRLQYWKDIGTRKLGKLTAGEAPAMSEPQTVRQSLETRCFGSR